MSRRAPRFQSQLCLRLSVRLGPWFLSVKGVATTHLTGVLGISGRKEQSLRLIEGGQFDIIIATASVECLLCAWPLTLIISFSPPKRPFETGYCYFKMRELRQRQSKHL